LVCVIIEHYNNNNQWGIVLDVVVSRSKMIARHWVLTRNCSKGSL